MKAYRKLTILTFSLLALILLLTNLALFHLEAGENRGYRVEISRAASQIREVGIESLDLSRYPSILRVTQGKDRAFLQGGEDPYVLREIEGKLYRFDYQPREGDRRGQILAVNLGLGTMGLMLMGIMGYLGIRIIKPFETMKKLPEELAKGNLTMPLQQQKSRYFGNFLWGMDLLREKLESQKAAELQLQKEKKSLILSLAHDIKTPLSAIKLYSQALNRNLYEDPEKQREAAEKIGMRADEIEDYLKKITKTSREDFLHLEVHMGEFYLLDGACQIRSYYEDKLKLLKIPCVMDFGTNCLLKGDPDRFVEILQNLIENAIKYGKGQEIRISSSEEENLRILTVSSGSCSLQQAELPHLFDSFFRGSNSQGVKGSGLGLYICRQLASAMGGDLFAELKDQEFRVSLVLPKA